MTDDGNELVFCALGGLGEIGRNAALYGFGPPRRRKWLMVDCGVSFAGPDLPGVDLVLPNPGFIERMRSDLVGLVITHAHEDHIGAVADLWPRLGCRVFATPFAASLLEIKRLNEPGAPRIPIEVVTQGSRLDLAPFAVDLIAMAHSIPESTALAIRTPLGTVLHSGDWKIDPRPVIGAPTDQARLTALGDEGVLALVCDSTNILREGESPSESDVATTLHELIANAPARVPRHHLRVEHRPHPRGGGCRAGGGAERHRGRAGDGSGLQVARECGYLDGIPPFLGPDSFSYLARDQTVVVATGSQGEVRAALARLARDDHPDVKLAPGDRVIFSSRTIRATSGRWRRSSTVWCCRGSKSSPTATAWCMCRGIRAAPRSPSSMGGSVRRSPSRRMASPCTSPSTRPSRARWGWSMSSPRATAISCCWPPGGPGIVGEAPHGRLCKDGNLLVEANDPALQARVRLSFAGIVSIAFGLSARGEVSGDPDVVFSGLPARTRDGKGMDALIDAAIFETLDGLGRGKRRDADAAAAAVERAVRNAVGQAWGEEAAGPRPRGRDLATHARSDAHGGGDLLHHMVDRAVRGAALRRGHRRTRRARSPPAPSAERLSRRASSARHSGRRGSPQSSSPC